MTGSGGTIAVALEQFAVSEFGRHFAGIVGCVTFAPKLIQILRQA
jgi:hypothetical protein